MCTNKKRVVVTGLGAVTPIGNNIQEFWDGIRSGRSGLGTITKFDPSRVDCRVAAEVKGFEVAKHIEPKEARRMALFTQYAVSAAKMAWADAGLDKGGSVPERVAVILGNGIGGTEVSDETYKVLAERGPGRISPMAIPKMISNEAAGNISMSLQAKGVVHTINTACASSTDALGIALDVIRSGRADIVIGGGTEASITEFCIGGFCALKALATAYNDAPTKASRPFDAKRDGFVMGEGSGILILEEYEHAVKRGARIYAELAGYGGTGDAHHLTAPHPEGEGAIRAMRLAMEDAGLAPDEIDYVNAHGTSTPLNDPMETKAVKGAFGEHAKKIRMSSTKSMTGHLMGAAGAVEAVVCVLALRDQFYPPTINYENPDPACDINCVPNQGVSAPMRAALSTSLGFGGHNGVLAFRKVSA
jgi:3-oxoacyl-[acyl-carrier-protein] synthase II